MKTRLEVREQVLLCEKCDLHTKVRAPVPFTGPSPTDIAIMGEAPGHNEDKKGAPFCGPAGLLLRRELTQAGIDPERVFIFNAVCCFPREYGKARRPSDGELQACAPNRNAQLALAQPKWLLVLGGTALGVLRTDLKISKARGRPFCLFPDLPERAVVFPTYHPSAALRNGNFLKAFQEDLRSFKELVEHADVLGWIDHLPTTCIVCGEESDPWVCDLQGVVYCQEHQWSGRGNASWANVKAAEAK